MDPVPKSFISNKADSSQIYVSTYKYKYTL